MKTFDRRLREIEIALWVFFMAAVIMAIASIAEAVLILRGTPEAAGAPTAFPTPGSGMLKATPEPLKFRVMKIRVDIPAGFAADPGFWAMLTPEGQAVLAGVTVIISDEPRYYACPQVWEVGGPTPTPEVCTYYGGIYEGGTNTIGLWGEAAQADPDILRHEALHALDAADGQAASETPFQKLAAGLVPEAEALYNAGGGTWFRPGELYAMIPLVVGWDFDQLPPAVAVYYADWFVGAER